ncbi:unannotated protein [freshwater metagenome]|uniref:Unannotated protein n=1 Tax=freshwater metagenome TaxID=449393 RepID=A0A6J7K2B7_9ZZZZ|nr:alpha/beta hydrolase fold domain-containing protein [Actinomycetota bacterium]
MPLDPQSQSVLDLLWSIGFPKIDQCSVDDARAALAAIAEGSPPGPSMASVHDLDADGVPVRAYTPEGVGVKPVIVYFLPGGWVTGTIAGSDAYCRLIADLTGAVVVSVGYRLAPEHPFPAAVDDSVTAATWVSRQAARLGADPERLVLWGDSSGANLAAVVARKARDSQAFAVAMQVLSHPVTDHDLRRPSYLLGDEGMLITRAAMVTFWDYYLPDVAQRGNPDASPLRAESLAGLAAAYVLTSGCDPMRDEGLEYIARLREDGVDVSAMHFESQFHCFNLLAGALPAATAAVDDAVAAVLRVVG